MAEEAAIHIFLTDPEGTVSEANYHAGCLPLRPAPSSREALAHYLERLRALARAITGSPSIAPSSHPHRVARGAILDGVSAISPRDGSRMLQPSMPPIN